MGVGCVGEREGTCKRITCAIGIKRERHICNHEFSLAARKVANYGLETLHKIYPNTCLGEFVATCFSVTKC